jgi:hypothetical protein
MRTRVATNKLSRKLMNAEKLNERSLEAVATSSEVPRPSKRERENKSTGQACT